MPDNSFTQYLRDADAKITLPVGSLADLHAKTLDNMPNPNPDPNPDPTDPPTDRENLFFNFGTDTYPDLKVHDGQRPMVQGETWIDSFRRYGVRQLDGNNDQVSKEVVTGFTHVQEAKSLLLRAGSRNGKFVGGMISLEDSMSMMRGRLEVRFKINSVPQGYHFAIWTLQNDGQWPPEFDFLEFVRGQPGHGSNGKFHFNDHARQGGPHHPPQNISIVPATDIWNEWNTVSLEVEDSGTTWRLNDDIVRQARATFLRPHHFLASWEGGSNWPGTITDTSAVAEIEFDYVKIDKIR